MPATPEHVVPPDDTRTPAHASPPDQVARWLGVTLGGLTTAQAGERLDRYGYNRLPPPPQVSARQILLRQFRSPLIYILLAAAAIALSLGEVSDAIFIALVLAINATIGFYNEFRAESAVQALRTLIRSHARVRRDGRAVDLDGELLVPGDLLLLESGTRIAADARLVEANGLRVDQSFLTGESLAVEKSSAPILDAETPSADRTNLVYAGSLVASGRAIGLVVATGAHTEVGRIARALVSIPREPTPLMRRMQRFAHVIGIATLGLAGVLLLIGLVRQQAWAELLLGTVALAVSAIPEGLPVALTVALAVAVSRMAQRSVVIRQLPAVEGLGSCSVIACDKTGTLTQNELTVEKLILDGQQYEASGTGYAPIGDVSAAGRPVLLAEDQQLFRTIRAACLANEASLVRRSPEPAGKAPASGAQPSTSDAWEWSGDPTDVALLSLCHKAGLDPVLLEEQHERLGSIPFEPEYRYAASFHRDAQRGLTCVKGAPERVVAMCDKQFSAGAATPKALAPAEIGAHVQALMERGYRVIAVADGLREVPIAHGATPHEPSGLTFLGLIAMTDPPRPGVEESVRACRHAGIRVVMVTGDHATTAQAVAQRVGLLDSNEPADEAREPADPAPVLTGEQLAALTDEELARKIPGIKVVARAAPADKLRVVRSLQSCGDQVAVTGDGVNDAPALRQADLGVAMGRQGTDVAREAADLVLTNDDFSSIVAGVEEGRIAYDNVRKVTYLLISTGLGELILVTLALALGFPIPFTAAQLLWLNLVTNGVQDVTLAFEPGEPDVLSRPPRPTGEAVFDKLMIERTLIAGGVFGVIGLVWWAGALASGYSIDDARSLVVQLFVLFEIFHIGNSRSERRSMFALSPFSNPLLLMGTVAALSVHLLATYNPFMQSLLDLEPLSATEWLRLVLSASVILLVMEVHKAWRFR